MTTKKNLVMDAKEIVTKYFLGIGYLFMLTLVGVLVVSLYSYFDPIDLMSESSAGIVAFIFAFVVVVDLGLVFSEKLTPTIILILILISPVLVLYKLIKDTDLIQINRSTPKRLKDYIPPRFITG
ncbi:MAG: hypothetical protein WC556_07950 [Candidatus Methanoperedens sp.]